MDFYFFFNSLKVNKSSTFFLRGQLIHSYSLQELSLFLERESKCQNNYMFIYVVMSMLAAFIGVAFSTKVIIEINLFESVKIIS